MTSHLADRLALQGGDESSFEEHGGSHFYCTRQVALLPVECLHCLVGGGAAGPLRAAHSKPSDEALSPLTDTAPPFWCGCGCVCGRISW